MALQAYPRTLLTLPVSDRILADTRVRQQATFLSLLHVQAADGSGTAHISVRIDLFAAQGDSYGPPLRGDGFSSYTKQLNAANDTLVEEATGQVLAIQQPGQAEADWLAHCATFEQATMLQGDFFLYLRDKGLPGTIRQMIEQYIQQADAAGKFA